MASLKLVGPRPLLALESMPRTYAPDLIDLSEVTWLSPFDVAALGVIWKRLAADGRPPEFVEPKDSVALRHFQRTGLAALVSGGWLPPELPLLRLNRLAMPEDWDEMLVDLWPEEHGALPRPSVARGMVDILSELIDNAGTHGRGPAGTFIAAERYPRVSGVWLAVADGGRGIPAHLRSNPRYRDINEDRELIRLARQPAVTGTDDRRGWGLVEVFEQGAEIGPSEVLIRSGSGEGYFLLRAGLPPFARYREVRPAVPGTWVHIRLDAT